MEVAEVGVKVETKKAEKNVEGLVGGIQDLTSAVKEGNEQTAAGLKNIEETSKSTGEGVKGIGNAIKAAGVGLFLIALESMKELFMQNQQVADLVGSAFEGLALVFNDVFGLLTGGQESVKKLGDAFDKYFGQPIKTATQAFEKFGDAFSKIFGGDFSGALESAQEGFSGLGDAISQTGDGFVEAATDAAEYAIEIKDAAVANVQLAKAAELAEAKNTGLLEKYDRQAEQQRQIRDEERNSIDKRIEANVKLKAILEEQNKTMLENAKVVERAAQAAFDKNKSTENEVALITAKNEVMAVEATVEGFRSEQLANELALDKEKIELTNSKLESETNLSLERQKFDAEQEANNVKRIESLITLNETEKLIQEERLQRIIDEANEGTQAKIDAQIALDEFTEANRQESLTLTTEYSEALAEDAKFLSDKVKESEEQKRMQRHQTLNDLLTIVGEETKIGRAILIAKQLMIAKEMIMEAKSTLFAAQQSATKSVIKASEAGVDIVGGAAKTASTVPFPFNIPLIIGYAAQAVGIYRSIKQAMKAQKAATSGLGVSTPSVDLASPSASLSAGGASQAPDFNVVGTTGTNQLADAIGSQNQAPIRAYVVSGDVTTSQSLDRNIVDSATL